MISAEDRRLLNDRHFAVRQNDGTTYLCDDCGLIWPCPTKKALRALEAAEARVKELETSIGKTVVDVEQYQFMEARAEKAEGKYSAAAQAASGLSAKVDELLVDRQRAVVALCKGEENIALLRDEVERLKEKLRPVGDGWYWNPVTEAWEQSTGM